MDYFLYIFQILYLRKCREKNHLSYNPQMPLSYTVSWVGVETPLTYVNMCACVSAILSNADNRHPDSETGEAITAA